MQRFGNAARWGLRVAALLLAFGLPVAERAALAQQPSGAPVSRQSLRQALESRYEVLPIRNGVVLKPRTESLGVRTVEVSGDTIAVNGERVSEGVLRAWLGEQAEPILQLRRLPAGERQALFDLRTGTGDLPIPEETPAEETPAEEVPDEEGTMTSGMPEAPEAPEIPEAPEAPEEPEDEVSRVSTASRVKFGGGITVEEGEVVEEAVVILGSVRVDGEVSRDVAAVGGSVTVNGRVDGNVVAVGGSVHLGPDAEILGDVTSVGGTIEREEGARIHGSTQEVGVSPGRDWDDDVDFGPGFRPFFGGAGDVIWKLIYITVMALLVFLCLLVARRPLEEVERYVAAEPWKAGAVGFLSVLLFIPLLVVVTILLAITIIGCALYLLYPFLFIGILLALLLGYAAVAYRLGRFLEARFNRSFGNPYGVALMGVLAIEIWSLIGRVIGLAGGFLDIVALMILVGGFAVQCAAWLVGFGAVLLARFGSTPGRWPQPATAPLPPPPPLPGPMPAYEGPGMGAEPLPLSERWEDPAADDRRWEEPPPPER
ncbi:MAG TPA: polymer-forming cytoskeletal protein [Thermoanaerobaculia bacterium]